jgi:hypothetical protein
MPTLAEIREQLSMHTAIGTLAWLSPIVAALVLAFPSGGYFVTDWGMASIVLLGCLAVSALLLDVRTIGAAGGIALAGIAGLGVWQGISGAWAFEPAAAIDAMNLTFLYAAAFGLVLLGIRGRHDLAALLTAALAATAAIAAYAVGSRLLPGLIGGDEQARLSNPITYWNGLGTIAALGVALALGLGGAPSGSRTGRAAAAALVPLFLLTLLLTYSRGAALVLLVAIALLVALAPGRLETVAAAVLTGAASVPLLLHANGEDAIAALSGVLPPHESEGQRVLLVLLATMAVCAALGWTAAALVARLPGRRRRIVGVGAAALVAGLLAVVLVARAPDQGYVRWSQDQFTSFKRYDTAARMGAESVADRLAVAAGTGRWQNWGVALDEFQGDPILGSGAGDYVFFWQQERDIDLKVVNAHSLYLETLGETGVIGLLLLLTPAAVAAVLFARAGRRGYGPGREVAVALSAAAIVALHAAGDWDWQLPAVVLPAVALTAGAIKAMHAGDDPPASVGGGAARWIVAAASVAAIIMISGPVMSGFATDDARDAASRGDLAQALAKADAAISLRPQDPSPRLVRANVLSDLGRDRAADAAFAAAAARSPRDWSVFADWANALARRGDEREAVVAAERAHALNPRESRVRYLRESLSR